MRGYLKFFILLALFGCKKDEVIPIVGTTSPTTNSTILSSVTYNEFLLDSYGLDRYANHVSPMTYYRDGGNDYMLLSASGSSATNSYPTLQLKKTNGIWGFSKYFEDCKMGIGRNYEFTNDGIVYADHGVEIGPSSDWPYGDLYYGKFKSGDINWTKISITGGKSFYHDVSAGDLNGDGLTDVVGVHMGVKGPGITFWDPFHIFIQNSDGSFVESPSLVNHTKGGYNRYNSSGAILVKDLNKDGKPEIVKATYGALSNEKRYAFIVYSFNPTTKQYEVVAEPPNLGIFGTQNVGATSIESNDFDGDGDVDLAIAFEGPVVGVQIYWNNGNLNFTTSTESKDLLSFGWTSTTDQRGEMTFREFNLVDFDNDNDMDIVLNPFANGTLFRSDDHTKLYLESLFWRNDKAAGFSKLTNRIEVKNSNPVNPDFIKGYMIDGVFKFIGTKSDANRKVLGVYEITVPKEALK